jgi:aryl-alcohol dehydrogenase-like predicted oxidoreductase
VDSLQPPFSLIRGDSGADVIPWAVAWALAWLGETEAIVGTRNAAQVDGWIAAGSLVLSREDLDEIASAITTTGAGSGPIHAATPAH